MPTPTGYSDLRKLINKIQKLQQSSANRLEANNHVLEARLQNRINDLRRFAQVRGFDLTRLIHKLNKPVGAISLRFCDNCQRIWPSTYTNMGSFAATLDTGEVGSVCTHCASGEFSTNMPGLPGQRIHLSRNPRNIIRNYSADPLSDVGPKKLVNETRPLYLGVELELSMLRDLPDNDFYKLLPKVKDALPWSILKSDVSIPGQGFEIATTPMTLGAHRLYWPTMFEAESIKSFAGKKGCGLHVHIDRRRIKPFTLGKMNIFYNQTPNRSMLKCLSRRTNEEIEAWARWRDNPKVQDIIKNIGGRGCLNISNGVTAEVRIFRSTISPAEFFSCLEFTHASVHFCSQSSLRQLEPVDFGRFLHHNLSSYPALVKWWQNNHTKFLSTISCKDKEATCA